MEWIKSSFCNTDHVTGNCVEANFPEAGGVVVRSSTNPRSTVSFSDDEWDVFLAGVREGEFNRP